MEPSAIAERFAGEIKTHHSKLEGKAGDVQSAQAALEAAAKAVEQERTAHQEAARTLMSHWESKATEGFSKKADKLHKDLDVTAKASAEAAKIVAEVTKALDGRHGSVGGILEEFLGKAGQLIQAGLGALGVTAPAGLMKAVGQVSELGGQYTKQSGGELKDARDEMAEAARKLRALLKELNADGVADPKPDHGQQHPGEGGQHKPGDGKKKTSDKAQKIVEEARKHVGYHEGPNNQNKWGPTGQPWCSYFATSMWREAGVDIDKEGFSGAVYDWGEKHHTAYDKGAIDEQARPGDAMLFGTGPDSASTSTHIGIVEKVDGNKITLIEGNASDQVQRNTYELPRDAGKFYGGVHPK